MAFFIHKYQKSFFKQQDTENYVITTTKYYFQVLHNQTIIQQLVWFMAS